MSGCPPEGLSAPMESGPLVTMAEQPDLDSGGIDCVS